MREDSLREALRRAASGEPPAGDAYARFLARRQRGVRLRGFVALAAGSAAVATLFLVLPGPFNQGPPANFAGGGPREPVGDVRHYVDPKAGFQLDYPADWLARGVAGQYADFFPPNGKSDGPDATLTTKEFCETCGGSSIESGRKGTWIEYPLRFYIEIRETSPCAECSMPQVDTRGPRSAGAEVVTRSAIVGGVRAQLDDFIYPKRPIPLRGGGGDVNRNQPPIGPDEWCSSCRVTEYSFVWDQGWRLLIRVVAPDASSSGNFSAEVARIVESFRSSTPAAGPTAYP